MPALHQLELSAGHVDHSCSSCRHHAGCSHHTKKHDHEKQEKPHDAAHCAICHITALPLDVPDTECILPFYADMISIALMDCTQPSVVYPRLFPYSCGPPV